jgi:hypothetical protein
VSDSRKPFAQRRNREFGFFAEAVFRILISPVRSLLKTEFVGSDNLGQRFGQLGGFVRASWGIHLQFPKMPEPSTQSVGLVCSDILGEMIRASWGKPTTDPSPKFGHLGGFVRTSWGEDAKLFGHLGAIRSGILGRIAAFRVLYGIFEFS